MIGFGHCSCFEQLRFPLFHRGMRSPLIFEINTAEIVGVEEFAAHNRQIVFHIQVELARKMVQYQPVILVHIFTDQFSLNNSSYFAITIL